MELVDDSSSGPASSEGSALQRSARAPGAPSVEVEAALERAKLEWEAAVDALPQLVCAIDGQGRILRTNRTAERWGLAGVGQVRGMDLDGLLHGRCQDPGCYLKAYLRDALPRLRHGERARCQAEDRVLGRPLDLLALPTVAPREDAGGRLGGSFSVVVVEDLSDLRRTEAALRHSESELRLLSAQLLTSQEMERKRIASELHDSVGASLAAIKLAVERAIEALPDAGGQGARAALEPLVLRMREAVAEVRRIAMDLRPATLDDLGLLATLSWFFRDFSSIHPAIRVIKDIDVGEGDIAVPLKTAVFRIVQEGVSNALKHAGSEILHLSLRRVSGQIELILEDRGCGFDPAAAADGGSGLGLISMRDRALLSGGTFEIHSAPGQGCRLRATWPCAARSG